MVQDAAFRKTPSSERQPDPNVQQRRASDPALSSWAGASAGTGKTKVLTDRLLRLMLPSENGEPGAAPGRLLCLTFTKAGAGEMAVRLSRALAQWAVAEDAVLEDSLTQLTGQRPSPAQIKAARQLFARVGDEPGGLKIMTIHSFCQSVLARFPLEAGLLPGFTVLEESAASELRQQAQDETLAAARAQHGAAISETAESAAFRRLAVQMDENGFGKLLLSACGERAQLDAAFAGGSDIHERLLVVLGGRAGDTEEKAIARACRAEAFDQAALRAACRALAEGTYKTDVPKGILLQQWLDAPESLRAARIELYGDLFINNDGDLRAALMTKALAAKYPAENAALAAEGERILRLQEEIRVLRCARLSADLMILARSIVGRYEALKKRRGALDFEDLIIRTRTLLAAPDAAPWVMFKLDGGIDHVLVDEAQDTNPEQWDIVRALCDEFFAGKGTRDDRVRTLFVVGDEKQSIFSFQRAAPEKLAEMRSYFARKAGDRMCEVPLAISFRTVSSVLRLVDETFADMAVREGLGAAPPMHLSHRVGQGGFAEIWPVFGPVEDEKDEDPPWTLPLQIKDTGSGGARLADHIGKTIAEWLERGEILPARGRSVCPGDIMILLRTRSVLTGQIVRALKTRGIPVSGVDRMVLGDQLAVMDLLAAARFALLPRDSLSLACLLKSPLAGWNEDRLLAACQTEGETLWDKLVRMADAATLLWLGELRKKSASLTPYEFFAFVLRTPCPGDEVSGMRALTARLGADARDPVEELLAAALDYGRTHVPTLQGFVAQLVRDDIEIKREMEEAGSCVRIMTVHGSKGLQAPVVFLPDTLRGAPGHQKEKLLWPDKSAFPLPLWIPREEDAPQAYKKARARIGTLMDEEYRRLLYVAMTRAEDRLYICGHKGSKTPTEESWYNYINRAFSRLEGAETVPFAADGVEGSALRFSNPQTREPEDKKAHMQQKDGSDCKTGAPKWLFTAAPQEPDPPRPLVPSRAAGFTEPPAASPLAGTQTKARDEFRFRRGNATHRLLQFLPALGSVQRYAAAQAYLAQPGLVLPEDMQRDIAAEVMAILEHPDYAPLFGPGSLAEVPLTGLAGGRIVSGQIDRLVVTPDSVMVVDYKTNRPPPQRQEDIPDIYLKQMQAYRLVLEKIYHGRPVRGLLLWTDGPVLMAVP